MHTAFALPINQGADKFDKLSEDIANSIRTNLNDLVVIIIDEVSMVSLKLLEMIVIRLRQITDRNVVFH